jgi:uncharacterized membrane protein YdcZ (DUF606 family)
LVVEQTRAHLSEHFVFWSFQLVGCKTVEQGLVIIGKQHNTGRFQRRRARNLSFCGGALGIVIVSIEFGDA